jgi:hypothetical protein
MGIIFIFSMISKSQFQYLRRNLKGRNKKICDFGEDGDLGLTAVVG